MKCTTTKNIFTEMRNIIIVVFVFFSLASIAQENKDALKAQQLFEIGEYNQSIVLYEQMMGQNPFGNRYYKNILQAYIKTKQFEKAIKLIEKSSVKRNSNKATYLVDLGYVYKRKGDAKKSKQKYEEAIEIVKKHPNTAYFVGKQFHDYLELRLALKTYIEAGKTSSNSSWSMQKANLYGELGNVDSMLICYFELIETNPSRKESIKRYLKSFLQQNPSPKISDKVKYALLLKIQETNNPAFSELLLWYFTENKKYNSAFIQAKSLYKRNYISLKSLYNLGQDAIKTNELAAAEKYFDFICNEDTTGVVFFDAKKSILEMQDKKKSGAMPDDEIILQYEKALNKKAINNSHFNLIISYVKFIAYKKNNPDRALEILEERTKVYARQRNLLPIKSIMEGDLYLLKGDFTKSFLAYQKAEVSANNNFIIDQAKFKSVKVSFYKGDFKWALSQSKILKKSVSKWYANDAAEMTELLQSSYESDSSEISLKLYAKADLLKIQGKKDSSYAYYNQIIENFPNHYLVPAAMFYQAEILRENESYEASIRILEKLCSTHPKSSFVPMSMLEIGKMYKYNLYRNEDSQKWLKKILLNFSDSYIVEEARGIYRG